MKNTQHLIAAMAVTLLFTASCSGSSDTTTPASDTFSAEDPEERAGIRLVSAQTGADIQASPPDGLIILDVRTPEEFAEGHLAGAIMVDFYDDDFADQLAELDPDVPYLLYCRSGNRSGQTTAIMDQLGFADVADVDGGILSWSEAGLPVVSQ